MLPFHHHTPAALSEAIELLAAANGSAQVIAGGTDLVLQMRNGLKSPQTIINIKRLPELQGIDYDDEGGLRLGALTTLRQIHRSPLIQAHYPILSHAAGQMASEQIRAFATVGGNLCNGSPSADQATPLLALDAGVHLAGPQGTRALPLHEFFLGPGQTALRPGELLQWISIPPPRGQAIFSKHIPRAFMDISVVCVALRLELGEDGVCQQARVVLGAVAPTPLRARQTEALLRGSALSAEQMREAARSAAAESRPIDDAKGSAWYRRRMVEVLVQRGLSALGGGA